MRQSIEDIVQSEAEAATGGGQLADIYGRVTHDLAALVTLKTRKPKVGGPYAEAITVLEEVSAGYEAVSAKAAAGGTRRQRLQELHGLLASHADDREAGAGSAPIETAEHALEAARTVFEGEAEDVSVGAYSIHTPEGRYDGVMRTPEFFRGIEYLMLDGRLIRLDIPEDASMQEMFKDHTFFPNPISWK